MTKSNFEDQFALKPIPKDDRIRQVRHFKLEVRKKFKKILKEKKDEQRKNNT